MIECRVDGERCLVSHSVDGEEACGEDLPGYKRVTLTVTPDGAVDADAIVY